MVADSVEWASETPKGLWKKITDEVQAYFGYRLDWSVMYCTYSRDSRLSFFLRHLFQAKNKEHLARGCGKELSGT